jgi:FkbM family methyltransferase
MASMDRIPRPRPSQLEALQVRLRVREGRVGVGLLDESGTKFLDAIDGFGTDSISEVTFLVRGLEHVSQLVLRNAAGGRATVELLSVDSFQLKEASAVGRCDVFPDEVTPVPGWNRYYGGFGADAIEHTRQLLFSEATEPFVMRWRNDLQIVITPGEETSRALFVSGMYEPASMRTLQRFLFPGAAFFDIGANVGVFTLAGSRRVGSTGHVYAFEPSSRERATLEKNVALNGCGNVTVIPSAAGDRSGTAILRVAAGQHRGQNTLAPTFAYPNVHMERVETVTLVTLDELWKAQAVRRPDVLKIDAEGSELQVLRGAESLLRNTMPVVMFEINDALLEASGASRAAIERFLTALGYRLHRLDDATADLVPVNTLTGVDSENFVAQPAASAH